jgi:hypothetical protein
MPDSASRICKPQKGDQATDSSDEDSTCKQHADRLCTEATGVVYSTVVANSMAFGLRVVLCRLFCPCREVFTGRNISNQLMMSAICTHISTDLTRLLDRVISLR